MGCLVSEILGRDFLRCIVRKFFTMDVSFLTQNVLEFVSWYSLWLILVLFGYLVVRRRV